MCLRPPRACTFKSIERGADSARVASRADSGRTDKSPSRGRRSGADRPPAVANDEPLPEDLAVADVSRSERRDAEWPFERLVELTDDVILAMDLGGVITAANPGAARVLGFSPDALVGTSLTDYLAAADLERARATFAKVAGGAVSVRGEFEHIAKDGHSVFLDVAAFPIRKDGQVIGLEGIARDVSAHYALKAELIRQSLHDPLTGLPNRALCVDRIGQALSRAARARSTVAVLLLDVDEFKVVNDSLGHGAGDELLVELAARLRAVSRRGETIARMGGDEFVIVADGINAEDEVMALGERIQSVFREPFAIGGTHRQMTGSLGVALSGRGTHASELLRDADTAMYRVKGSGKGETRVFDQAHRIEFLQRIAVETGLRDAVHAGELEVYFQPIVDPITRQILAVEALSRWRHPELGWIQPGEFIPIAEESGLIVSLGQHVLREAVSQTAAWRRQRASALPLGVFVNVSPRELSERGFVPFVLETLTEFGLAPLDLALELTEHVIIDDRDEVVFENLGELARLGIRLIIDDFGTGYSALSSLRRFPFAALKIDRCFVEEIDSLEARAPIIRALVGLGKTLSMMVIAEGVESQVQQDYLLRLGCDAEQGFGTGRPQTATALTELLLGEQDPEGGPQGASEWQADTADADARWTPAPRPSDEDARVAALAAYDVLDSGPESEFDEIARLVAEICDTPMSFVSLVDRDREYFKAGIGTDLREAPRDSSFCGHAILESDVVVIEDALNDPRFAGNPNVIGGARVRFYAGAPLITPDGHSIGMLCVKDTRPRELTETQRHALAVLGHQVAALLELRRLRSRVPSRGSASRTRQRSQSRAATR